MTPSRMRCLAWSVPARSPLRPLPRRRPDERRDQVREALGRDLEAARYAADRAFRQYDAADPANRLVAGELEARWNRALAHVAEVEGKIAAHDAATPAAAVDPARARCAGVEPQDRLVGTDDRCAAEEAHRAHPHP